MKHVALLFILLTFGLVGAGCGEEETSQEQLEGGMMVGKVVDQNNGLLENVRVVTEGETLFQVGFTDVLGDYSLNVPEGEYTVVFEKEGCESVETVIVVEDGDSTALSTTLMCD